MTAPTDIFDQNGHGGLEADSASSLPMGIEEIVFFANKDPLGFNPGNRIRLKKQLAN